MKRFLSILLALSFMLSFAGCSRDTQSVIVLTKAPNTDAPDTETTSAETEYDGDYILNISSKKIHLPSCASVSQMKKENRKEFSGEAGALTEDGYSFCGICFNHTEEPYE